MSTQSIRNVILFTLLLVQGFVSAYAQVDRDFIRKGNRLYRQQQYDKAEAEYRKALSHNGENTQAIYNLGCALMMQQKDSAAIELYQRAGRMETNKLRKSQAYHNIGVICQNHQMYGEAIEAYKESLRNNPADNETRYNLALCQQLAKKQPKNNQNQNKDNQKKEQKDDKKDKDNQQNKDQKQNQNNTPQPKKEEMSKENAEQLLNAATQQEKQTQQRLKKAMQQPRSKHLQKNW